MRDTRKVFKSDVTSLAGAYAAGQMVGGLLTFKQVPESGAAVLDSLTVIDQANQKQALTLFLFSAPVTVGANQAAMTVSAADMAAYCLGKVEIIPANYTSGGAIAVATIGNLLLHLASEETPSGTNKGGNIYGVLMTSGTPTYGAGAKVTLRLGVRR